MKAKIITLTVFLSLLLLLQSCDEYIYKTYTGSAPVYMSYEELRSAVSTRQDAPIENPGKIFFKDNYIFMVEEFEGIHVFDNSNPSSPVKKTFVVVPGVMDISVSGDVLYADSYVDLVILDIADIMNIKEAGRMKDLLTYILPVTGNNLPMANVDIGKGVVTGWEVRTIREKERHYGGYIPYIYYETSDAFLRNVNPAGASGGMSGSGLGAGGSMVRFGIRDNVLYALGEDGLKILDISDKTAPSLTGSIVYLWGVKTMYMRGKYMFVGTFSDTQIFDLSVPLAPQDMGWFTLATACNPLIVDDTLAYVTLRNGTSCGGDPNVLNVINIKDMNNPVQLKSYPMTDPHGIGKDGDLLFVCYGSAGLKIYDAGDPMTLTEHLLKTYSAIHALNVIPVNGILFIFNEDGLYQYDYSDIGNISLLSSIVTD